MSRTSERTGVVVDGADGAREGAVGPVGAEDGSEGAIGRVGWAEEAVGDG